MDTPPPIPPPTGQTIIIERRDRAGLFRRLLIPLLLLGFGFAALASLLSNSIGLAPRLTERYVAGDLTGPKVAIIEIDGTIMGAETEHILRQIRQARDDELVRALVLRIDSPGGSVSSADQIWRELSIVKKPIVASLGGMAASGGYYVAAPSRVIIAEPTTLTGSIGVILQLPQIGGLLEKVGVRMETVATGRWKDAGSLYHHELGPEERQHWRALIDDSFDRFVRIVATGRKLSLASVKDAADGRVMTADEAVRLKLVDRIGYLDDAIREAWSLARIESSRVIRYLRPISWPETLLSMASPAPTQGIDLTRSAESLGVSLSAPQVLYLAR